MNGKGMSMENMHVNLTPFTSVPVTSKIDLINEKREGYVTFNNNNTKSFICMTIKELQYCTELLV